MARRFRTPEDKAAWEQQAKQNLIDRERQIISNPKHHYRLRPEVGFNVIDEHLSDTARRLWIYLCCLYPFGDRPEQMPTQAELAARLGVDRRSIIRAAAELEDAKLWTFKIERWKGQNLTGQHSSLYGRQSSHTGDKNVTPDDRNVTPSDKNVTLDDRNVTPDDRNVTPRPLKALMRKGCTTLQIFSDLFKTYSNLSHALSSLRESENWQIIFPIDSKPHPTVLNGTTGLNNPISQESQSIGEDQFSAPPAPNNFLAKKYIHPTEQADRQFQEKPWGAYSKPDPDFLSYLVRVYLPSTAHYQKTRPTIAHARKWLNQAKYDEQRHDDALIQWEAYQEWRSGREQPTMPVAPAISLEQQRIETLNAMLRRGELQRVKQTLDANPAWQLQLSPSQQEVITANGQVCHPP